MLSIGLDLAWRDGGETRIADVPRAKETGIVVLDRTGAVVDAGWERGLDRVVARLLPHLADPDGAVIAVDAPLVVHNAPKTMRECEREVGRRYGRWGFSAYPSHTGLAWLAGVALRERLESLGAVYTDGVRLPRDGESVMFECYPSTTLVGAEELGYATAKPRYKVRDPALSPSDGRAARALVLDEMIRRIDGLRDADPPLLLSSHPVTAELLAVPSPHRDAEFKHREDLLDAVLCAWTAALWHRWGGERCQVLGLGSPADEAGRVATIVAPARPEQRDPTALGGPATTSRRSSSPPPSPPS